MASLCLGGKAPCSAASGARVQAGTPPGQVLLYLPTLLRRCKWPSCPSEKTQSPEAEGCNPGTNVMGGEVLTQLTCLSALGLHCPRCSHQRRKKSLSQLSQQEGWGGNSI